MGILPPKFKMNPSHSPPHIHMVGWSGVGVSGWSVRIQSSGIRTGSQPDPNPVLGSSPGVLAIYTLQSRQLKVARKKRNSKNEFKLLPIVKLKWILTRRVSLGHLNHCIINAKHTQKFRPNCSAVPMKLLQLNYTVIYWGYPLGLVTAWLEIIMISIL